MTKTTGKFCCLMLAVLVMVLGFSAPARAEFAKDMKYGTWNGYGGHRWIRFGKHTWRVLSVEVIEIRKEPFFPTDYVKEALLLTEDIVDQREFDVCENYDWRYSDIKEWLNGSFYNSAFSDDERNAILTSSYSYRGEYGANEMDSSKIFLLSYDEALDENYFADKNDRRVTYCYGSYRKMWWLRSPGPYQVASLVDNAGNVFSTDPRVWSYGISPTASLCGIRPALRVNLLSPIFASPILTSFKYEVLHSPR